MSDENDKIDPRYVEQMNDLAHGLDGIFNGNKHGEDRTVCFVLLITDFGHTGRVNYISNGNREDVIVTLKEIIARNEEKKDGGTDRPSRV